MYSQHTGLAGLGSIEFSLGKRKVLWTLGLLGPRWPGCACPDCII